MRIRQECASNAYQFFPISSIFSSSYSITHCTASDKRAVLTLQEEEEVTDVYEVQASYQNKKKYIVYRMTSVSTWTGHDQLYSSKPDSESWAWLIAQSYCRWKTTSYHGPAMPNSYVTRNVMFTEKKVSLCELTIFSSARDLSPPTDQLITDLYLLF